MKRWGSGDRFLADDRRHPRRRSPTPRSARRSSSGSPARPSATTTSCSSSSTPRSSTGPASSRSRPRTARPRRRCPTRSTPSSMVERLRECEAVQEPDHAAPHATRWSGAEVEVLVDARRRRVGGSSAAPTARRPRSTASCTLRRRLARARARSSRAHVTEALGPDLVAKAAVARRAASDAATTDARRAGSRSERRRRSPRRRTSSRSRGCVARGAHAAAHHRPGVELAHRSLWFVLCVTDGLDGWLARRDGTTRSGAFLDPLADKFLVLGGFFALGIRGDFSWAAVAHRRPSARSASRCTGRSPAARGISLPGAQARQVEGDLPVPRGRRRAVPADVRVGDVPRHRPVVRGRATVRLGARHRSRPRLARSRPHRGGSMRCDVLAIGTELLLGQIVDTNSSWIGEQLAAAGIDTCEHRKVGDNLGRMVQCLRELLDARRRGHRVRRPRAHARRRHPRGDRRGDGRRARAARGAHRAHPRDLRWRAAAPMPENNLRQADVPVGGERDPQPDRHRARAAVRVRRRRTRSSTRCPACRTR